MSPSKTSWVPPTRPLRLRLRTRLRRSSPRAEAISWGPRCRIVWAAATSWVRPISSQRITFGVWFCTASISTAACSSSVGTIMRRARPRDGWTRWPLPQISLLVSTTTTLGYTSDRTRAASRIMVVWPHPGGERNSTECPRSTSFRKSAHPRTARPTRRLRPYTSVVAGARMAEIRCRDPSRTARLSSPNLDTPMDWMTWFRSAGVTTIAGSGSTKAERSWPNAIRGRCPTSRMMSRRLPPSPTASSDRPIAARSPGGSRPSRASRSSSISSGAGCRAGAGSSSRERSWAAAGGVCTMTTGWRLAVACGCRQCASDTARSWAEAGDRRCATRGPDASRRHNASQAARCWRLRRRGRQAQTSGSG
mmetsp:Transcript_99341/g.170995  ORF Transcript_99341/g.170995 Transcript_99341/m.170995 type:complete len:364 (+) Transcript_99341:878-1969(+)